jgi:hypothetical protein
MVQRVSPAASPLERQISPVLQLPWEPEGVHVCPTVAEPPDATQFVPFPLGLVKPELQVHCAVPPLSVHVELDPQGFDWQGLVVLGMQFMPSPVVLV